MTRHLNTEERRGAFYSLLSVFFFAANILCLRGIALHTPAADGWVSTFMRGTVGLLVLPFVFGRGRGLDIRQMFAHPLLLARGLLGGISIVILYLTVVHLGAGRAIIINLTYPLFGAILAATFMKEPLTLRNGGCLIMGFGGLVLFFSKSWQRDHLDAYDLLALTGAFLGAIVILLIRHLRHIAHPSTIYASQCFYCVLLTLPMSMPKTTDIPVSIWLALAGIAVFVACGQLLITYGFRYLSVAKGSGIQMLLPPLVAFGGMVLYGESFSLREALGATITITAIWFLLNTPSLAATGKSSH